MRKLLLRTAAGAALLASAAVPVSAADLAAGTAPPAAPGFAPIPAFTWTGAYIGVNIGGIWGEHQFDPVTATQTAGSLDGCTGAALLGSCGFSVTTDRGRSVIGGFQTGYRWQSGIWVIGVEEDFQWTDVKNSFVLTENTPFATGPFLAGDAFEGKLKWLSNTRAQLGVAFDRWLVYAAGGLATGAMDVTASYVVRPAGGGATGTPAYSVTDEDKWHIGWTAGAGIEYAITDNVSLGVEYRYTELSSETYNLGGFTFANGRSFQTTADVGFNSHEVLARLNIKTAPLLAMFGIR